MVLKLIKQKLNCYTFGIIKDFEEYQVQNQRWTNKRFVVKYFIPISN